MSPGVVDRKEATDRQSLQMRRREAAYQEHTPVSLDMALSDKTDTMSERYHSMAMEELDQAAAYRERRRLN